VKGDDIMSQSVGGKMIKEMIDNQETIDLIQKIIIGTKTYRYLRTVSI
jgi:hypothetical protein